MTIERNQIYGTVWWLEYTSPRCDSFLRLGQNMRRTLLSNSTIDVQIHYRRNYGVKNYRNMDFYLAKC